MYDELMKLDFKSRMYKLLEITDSEMFANIQFGEISKEVFELWVSAKEWYALKLENI